MAIEKYIALASLGLFAMFVGEILSVFHFLIDPPSSILDFVELDVGAKIIQFISIGVAPALVLTGTSFIMVRRYGSKPIGYMITAGGIILFIGMVFAYTMIEQFDDVYLVYAVTLSPPLFMAVSIPVIIIGVSLLKEKKGKPKKKYF